MPSGIENLEGNRFIIRYEYPFGGIASNAQPEDIAPNQFVNTQGMFIRDGVLASTNFYNFTTSDFLHSTDGVTPYITANATGFRAIYTAGNWLVAVDSDVVGWYYDFARMMWVQDQEPPTDIISNPLYSCSIMIEGIIYIFDYNNGAEWVYTPRNSMRLATQVDGSPQTFVAGKYCMTVDQYLITANTYMPAYTTPPPDNTPVAAAYSPSQYSWSGPGKYETFSPFADDTLNEGWNQLAGVQKEITGCFAMSNVGYIIHDQGLTQLTPTALTGGGNNAGLLPFDATDLWTGKDGIGCTMPDTLSVFGYFAMWGNNNDFYLFSAGVAPEPICGVAKKAIYKDITMFKYTDTRYFAIRGNIINCGPSNKNPVLVYNLYILYQTPLPVAGETPGGDIMLVVWSFVFESKTWTRTVIDISDIVVSFTNDDKTVLAVEDSAISTFRFPTSTGALEGNFFRLQSPLYGGYLITVSNTSNQGGFGNGFFFFQYVNSDGNYPAYFPAPNTTLIFRSEEFQLDRTPTIRGVILRASGFGTLTIAINGNLLSPITVNSPNGTTRYKSYGVVTDVNNAASLSITSVNFNGFISKVHVFGTYAEGEPI